MIVDGRKLADKIKLKIKKQVRAKNLRPGLGVILVGNDPASEIYVKAKEKACQEVGFYSRKIVLPADTSQKKIISSIKELNQDKKIHGVLMQLPLPRKFNQEEVIKAINPRKDVDCFHPFNTGELALFKKEINLDQILAPCTAKGVVKLIKYVDSQVRKKVVVVGRSNLTGKPIALLLLALGATVTICHSQTKDLTRETKRADILVVAAGKPRLIKENMVKKGAVVIDVGINRVKGKLVGDVDFEKVRKIAGFITSVPGGVGPMTIACLLENTLLLTLSHTRPDVTSGRYGMKTIIF